MKNIKIFAFLAIFLLSAAVSTAWAWKGSGTSDAPYQITSAADLTQLATDVNGGESYSNMYFKQTADITLSGEWTPIGTQSNPFKGHYDGGGFAIRGLRVTGNYKHAGLFGYISSDRYHGSLIPTELKNLNIVDCVIDVGTVESSVAGGIAGETGPVHITGNRVRGSITAYGNTGGLIGIIRSNATVSNNFVDVTVSGTGNQYNQYMHPEVCLMVRVSGGSSGGSGNYYHDNGGNVSVSLNTNISATPVYSVTVTAPVGLTDSDANVTLDGVKYYETGKTVTFGFSGSGSVVYFVNGERIEGNSVTVGQEDLTVQIGVPYIDEKGAPKSVTDFIVLTEDNKPNEDGVIELSGGWYVVQGKVEYTNQVKFSGDAHLILADEAEMVIESETDGIQADKNLTIYGQSKQNGTLNVTSPLGSEASQPYSAIYSNEGNITINGGTVTATGGGDGIYSYNGVTINGGKVTATGIIGVGIYSYSGNITISGGTVTATGNDGIYSSEGNITLGWTNSTDFIKVSSYYSIEGSVQIAEGKLFKDEDGDVYSGSLTGEQLSAIKGKKLEPCYAVALDLQDGKAPVMHPATFDENGVAHVKKPNDPIRSGFTFEGWFAAPEGGSEFDFTKAVTGNTTAYAHWNENTPVEYIDENGGTNETKNYILLTNDINVDNLPGGWYVVQGAVKYTSQVKFSGDAHLILADDATIEIETGDEHGIYASNNLTIYGQSNQNGILKATGNLSGIYGDNEVTINGGSVTATSTNGYGIYSYFGDITISGGKVTATGNSDGIYNDKGNITLGWTNSTDFIKVSSIHLGVDSCTVSIAEGKSFKDEKGNVYSGTLTGEQLSAIKGKTLEPCYAVTFDAQNGDDPIMLLTTFDENGVAHVKKPNDPIRSGFTFEGWFTATDGNTEFDFSAAITGNTTAYAHWTENTPVEYIDENGKTKTVTDYTVLTSSTNVSNLPGGWYVVQGEVKYTSQVKFSGDAHLILADGAEMEIKTEGKYGIYASKNLTIYGQNEQSGILNDTANGTNGIGIFSWSDITISGGKVTATGKNGYGIYGYEGVTISGGSVTASGNNSGINTNAGHITLGWTNSTDFIKVSSIHLGADSCTVSIAEGKSFVDENGNEYRGSLTDENLESIKNKTLTPLMPFPDNIVIANISGATYTGDSIRPEPVVTIGENVLELGKDYTLAYKDNLNASDTAKVIVKGAGKYYGEVQKLFTIDKAPLKITALNDTIVYGDEPADQGVAYDGFVGNETSEVLKGELALEIGYIQYDDAGKYAITPSGLNADNYKIEFVAGTLTVEPKVISIVWGEQTVFAYDGKEHVPTVTAEGFVEGHVARLVVTGAAVEVGNDTAKVALDENDANSKNYKLRASELEKEFKIVMPIAYIDENGVEQTVTDYTVLTSDIVTPDENGVITLPGGWYVAMGTVDMAGIVFEGNANLVLMDGAELNVENESGNAIEARENLTIYGQSGQSGILVASGNDNGIISEGNVEIVGGSVTVSGGENGKGITSKGKISISWANLTDRINVSRFYPDGDKSEVVVLDGKYFKDESGNVYSGKLNEDQIKSIEGKALVPFVPKQLSDVNIVVAYIPVQNYNDGEPVCPESVVLTEGKVTLKAGTDYTFACFNNTGISSATLDGAAYVEITGKGNYAGVIEKRFYIWKNLGDYAAVQIFEDENGKKHAVIDGEYEGTETVDIPNEIAVDAIEFVRDFDANTPSTVLLPFSLPSCATVNAKFYTLDNVSQSGNKWVATVASIGNALPEANTAYAVMLPTDGRLEFNFDGCSTAEKKQAIFQTGKIETSGNADGSWYFTGTYEFIHWSNPNYIEAVGDGLIYGFAGSNEKGIAKGQFGRVDYSAEINPLRCYLRKKSSDVKLQSLAKSASPVLKAAPYSISLLPETIDVKFVDKDENGEHTTAIGRMDTRTGKIRLLRTDRTYDLKGRRVNDVNRAAKGAYYGKKL